MKGLSSQEYWALSTAVGDVCSPACEAAFHFPFAVTKILTGLQERGLVEIYDCACDPENVCHARITSLGLEAKRIFEAIKVKP
jgi:hypothetical protein